MPMFAILPMGVSRRRVKPSFFGTAFLALGACDIDSGLGRVNTPPTVEISSPTSAELVRQGESLILVATVADEFDKVADLAVQWNLNDDAALSASVDAEGVLRVDLDVEEWEIGPHRVTVTVTDTDGATAVDYVDFEVGGPLGAPTVEITAPVDGYTAQLGTQISFTGLASDLTTPADDLEFAWTSSVDGSLSGAISGDGATVLLASTLSAGTHTITLAATDTDGEVGTDSIEITVESEPEPPEPGDLIFTEMMVNPNAASDEDGEWVELYNTSGRVLDIAGYSFHDDGSDEWVFDASVLVEPKSYVVICANVDPQKNGGVPCDAWFYRQPSGEAPPSGQGHGSGMAIANNDDELVLTSPLGIDIDIFDYDDTDSDPIEAGMGFGLDPTKLDVFLNDDVGNWCSQVTLIGEGPDFGTPGVENDPCP